MAFSRAERRHHRERLFRNRFKEQARKLTTEPLDSVEGQAMVKNWASRRVTAAEACSCWMCGNPRNYYGNSECVRTRQEQKVLLALNEYQKET